MWRNRRRGKGTQVLRVRHPTGTVGIGNSSTTSGSWLRLSSGRPLSPSRPNSSAVRRASPRPPPGGHPLLADQAAASAARAMARQWRASRRRGTAGRRSRLCQEIRVRAARSAAPDRGSRRFRSHPTDDQASCAMRPRSWPQMSCDPPPAGGRAAPAACHHRKWPQPGPRWDSTSSACRRPGRNRRVGDRGDRRARPGGTGPRRPGLGCRLMGTALGRHRRPPLWHPCSAGHLPFRT